MKTQELKSYIDRVLGNNIRCLLPSYWWKMLFNQVADRVDEVEQSTSKLIESKIEEVKMPIVESVDEMEKLELAKGRVAAVEKTGESATIKISDCYLSFNSEEDWSKYTIVKGVEEKDNVIIDKDTSVFFTASKGMVTKDALQVNTISSGIFYYMKWTDDEAYVTSLEEVNKALSSGKYRAVQCLNAPDDYFTFYSKKSQPSLYIKGDSWERLAKEYVVSSEEELNALSVEKGTIAKVAKWQYGEVDPYKAFLPSNILEGDNVVKENWGNLTQITNVELVNPETPPTNLENSANILLHGYATAGNDVIQITYYHGWVVRAGSSSSSDTLTLNELNNVLAQSDYRLIGISKEANNAEFIRTHTSLFSPSANIASDAYIKGDSWTRLLKEGDVTGGGVDITIDSELSDTSENPVQNKVVTEALGILEEHLAVHSKQISSLGLSMATKEELNNKADKSDIKTINGVSLLGGGDITISGGGVSEDYVNTAIANAITNTLNTEV